MRILALTNLYPNPYQPNRATFNRQDLAILAGRHAVRVVAPILWTDERAAVREMGRRLPPSRQATLDGIAIDHPKYWYTPKVLRGQYGRFFLWSVARTVRRVAAEFRPDLLYAPWAYPDGWAAVRLGSRLGVPTVLKLLGSDLRMLDQFPGRRGGTADALRRAAGVVAVSREIADRAIALGADRRTVRVVYSGVNLEVFRPGDRAADRAALGLDPAVRHLLSVGNLQPVKGPDVLIEAVGRLPAGVGPWQLHLVGDGPMRPALEARAAALGIADRVRFHGPKPHAELPRWFRAADLFVLASRSEGVPNVVLEASACETPYVATAVGGVPEVAHLGAGLLVPPDDPGRLAAAVAEALDRPPPPPAQRPRDRHQMVALLEQFLQAVLDHANPPTADYKPLAPNALAEIATPPPGETRHDPVTGP